uniref:Rep_fac-A_C domain-containing protein n=1 Tax=Elaeophora elaphi TaxID=1147741 RepID=A0A0R3RX12_9BILA
MELGKNRPRTSSCGSTTNSRRQSLTAQLTRTARRFSATVAPQLLKLEPLPLLQNYEMLNIRLAKVEQLQAAVEGYIIKNSVNFNPIDFEITDANNVCVLRASLHPEEMILSKGTKKIYSVIFDDLDSEECGTVIAKIRHPLSGIRIFEFLELPLSKVVQISSYIDQCDRCHIKLASNAIFNFFTLCNSCFCTPKKWQFIKDGKIYAFIRPNVTFFDENSLRLEWVPQADNELRMIVIAYGMTQMVREVFPSLNHIISEQYQQKNKYIQDCEDSRYHKQKSKEKRIENLYINHPITSMLDIVKATNYAAPGSESTRRNVNLVLTTIRLLRLY